MNRLLIPLAAIAMLWAGGFGCAHDCSLDEDSRTVTTDEIDAAGKLKFETARAEVLRSIAVRKGLSVVEQQRLVWVTMYRLKLDPPREQILTTLIDNPDFTQDAKSKIL